MRHGSIDGLRNKAHFSVKFGVKIILALSLALISCATRLEPVPENASSAEIIQRAQERSDAYDWKGAQYYYRTLQERFPDDLNLQVTAMYELAFIEYKQGHYEAARAGLQEVLALYKKPEGASLPQTWKILAEKVMAKLPSPGTTATSPAP
ncbi:MAG: hypothetical protein LWX23_06995 [Spirochaetia bacterium]|jgi:outer membrane protein assembly factor BamD (BamD/ComL family)|uniref:Outer membrane protein assembly factor BamD n=1 Tax=bioreactor metagenome TaxID=1076179 RepID=A0A644TBY2_9ZZZZ|nr:hypothetical protein [Spirochaetia bacterium]NLX46355.1 hypothetical protein [Treponema sp.]VBB38419.1 hypothetical protein TRIP_E100034 [uncultured Spirochaetota bacterium]HAP54636.1 hypothetical protein [Spirochaetaceae bacterium]HOI23198.1 hypothetical protein [Spirochaetales bacterium]